MATYEDVVNLALRRSLFYSACELYASAPAGFYSYGPYGLAIRQKIIEQWRKQLVKREGMLEIDSAITMPSDVFKASGHLSSFADPITTCPKCRQVYRADKLLSEKTGKEFKEAAPNEELTAALKDNKIVCPSCKSYLSPVTRSSLMVKTEVGVGKTAGTYLRPEACQSIFLDFDKLYKTMRVKLPIGIAQIGKAFRNEISPRQTLMRQVEFYQMDCEVFFNPKHIDSVENFDEVKDVELNIQLSNEKSPKIRTVAELVKKKIVSGKLIAYYLARTQKLFESYGFALENTRFRQLDDKERAFYAKEGWDFEVKTSLGWLELIANNYRTDYDLKGHGEGSKKDLCVLDEETNEKFIPHIWEISTGTDRTFYAIIENAYKQDDKHMRLSLPLALVPLDVAVLPLLSNKPELVKQAQQVRTLLTDFDVFYDESGSIGKRYARLDEVGVPFCVTIDFETIEKKTVTIRERDTAAQKRVAVAALPTVLSSLLSLKKKFSDI